MKQKLVIMLFFVLASLGVKAQVESRVTLGAKPAYQIGDELALEIRVHTSPETCAEGMEQVKFYQSGLEATQQSPWIELRKGLWKKDLRLRITGNRKAYAQLTVVRHTDKQAFTQPIRFDYTTTP